LRIFKLFNLFYEKFSVDKKKPKEIEEGIEKMQVQEGTTADQVIEYIQNLYKSETLHSFITRVSEILRIVYRTNLEINEGVSNLIFCVFASFYPELYESLLNEEQLQKEEADALAGNPNELSKYKVKMLPLTETMTKKQEKFVLFKNQNYFTNRIEELS
jgi:hypothetical protein